MTNLLKTHQFPIQIEGLPYIFGGFVLTLASFSMWHAAASIPTNPTFLIYIAVFLMALSTVFTVFSIWFYRNPPRQTPLNDITAIISPADGTILAIADVEGKQIAQDNAKKISIFMSPLDAHINRAPVTGQIETIQYTKGKFYRANIEKASQENENNWIVMKMDIGPKIAFAQIAGFIARRIVCYVRPGERLTRGERCGMIRFGSRAELLIPADSQILVKKGDNVQAGITKLARLKTTI